MSVIRSYYESVVGESLVDDAWPAFLVNHQYCSRVGSHSDTMFSIAARLVPELNHRSEYRKCLPGQVTRIRLKIKKNCRLFLDIFSSAIMNDLTMTFTFRLKMDANCAISSEIASEWRTVCGHPQLIECIGICLSSLALGSGLRVPMFFCIM